MSYYEEDAFGDLGQFELTEQDLAEAPDYAESQPDHELRQIRAVEDLHEGDMIEHVNLVSGMHVTSMKILALNHTFNVRTGEIEPSEEGMIVEVACSPGETYQTDAFYGDNALRPYGENRWNAANYLRRPEPSPQKVKGIGAAVMGVIKRAIGL